MTNLATLFSIIIICLSAYDLPLYKQCDPKWANQRLGTSANTICSDGCLMSSAAMALFSLGNTQFNPSTLNRWLTGNGGYELGDLFVWEAINVWGLNYIGKVRRDQIKGYLDNGYFVFPNVNKGGHWVLAYAYQGDSLQVMDAYYDRTSYELSEVVQSNTGVYALTRATDSGSTLATRLKKTKQLKPAQAQPAGAVNLLLGQ